MKNIVGLLLAGVIVMGLAPYARSIGTPAAPPGVAAADWIPLNESAGVVIAHDNARQASTAQAAGTVRGYIMVQRNNRWLRVDTAPEYGVQKAAMP